MIKYYSKRSHKIQHDNNNKTEEAINPNNISIINY